MRMPPRTKKGNYFLVKCPVCKSKEFKTWILGDRQACITNDKPCTCDNGLTPGGLHDWEIIKQLDFICPWGATGEGCTCGCAGNRSKWLNKSFDTVLELLVKTGTKRSKKDLRRLCEQGAITFFDPEGWGVFPDDKFRPRDPNATMKDIYDSEYATPNQIKIGRREFHGVGPRWEKVKL